MTSLLVVAALRSERIALTGVDATLERCGMGARRVRSWLPRLDRLAPEALVVAGLAGGIDPALRAGDVVVASEVRDASGVVRLPAAAPLVAELRRHGLRVHHGPIVTSDRLVVARAERTALAMNGVLAVDMESAPIVRALAARPVPVPTAVVRVVVDTVDTPLVRPQTLSNGLQALRVLRRVRPALRTWADLAAPRDVVLAAPRSFCAGVDRAIEIVEAALRRYPHPIYVRRQIVHNAHVVDDLQRRGVIFVDELDEIPDGTTVVFSAHGVAPAVRAEAARRELNVIDATCPLVAKVHTEARRFVAKDKQVLLVGHAGHDEVEGTLGQAPGRISLVQNVAEAETVEVADPESVAFVLQTTLGLDEAAATVGALRRRFPLIESSASDDICYATTNRQRAVAAIVPDSDVLLVVGSANSSNSRRLVEVAEAMGKPAHLIDDVSEVLPEWLAGASSVGVTAGASAPPQLVDELIGTLRAFGPIHVREHVVTTEDLTFTLPKGVAG
jgi:4-hydroxy-3-methylbut-2-enyl diphosphate reductase